MKPPRNRVFSRLSIFCMLGVLMGAAILFSEVVHKSFFTEDLQYIPQESELVVASGDFESLWNAIEQHFGEVVRDQKRSSFLASELKDIRKWFADSEVPIHQLSDLTRYGIDVKKGALCGIASMTSKDLDAGKISLVVLLHVHDQVNFSGFLTKLSSHEWRAKSIEVSDSEASYSVDVFQEDETSTEERIYIARPQADLALVSNSLVFLKLSLLNRRRNISQALASDSLYEGVRQVLKAPLMGSRKIFFFWRPKDELLSPVRLLVGAATLGEDSILLNVRVTLSRGGIRLIEDLYTKPPPADHWELYLGRESPAVLVLQDQDVSQYLRTLGGFASLRSVMDDDYGGVLGQLSEMSGFQRLVLAVTGYREGVPELTTGIWADPEMLRKLVVNLQVRFRQHRDHTILESALQKFSDSQEAKGGPLPTASRLRQLGFLSKEAPSFFERYDISGGKVGNADLNQEDFQDASYHLKYKGWSIDYLLPRVTQNDLRYRPEFKSLDRKSLLSDRYRLASVVDGRVLWISTDVEDLEHLLDRAQESPDILANSQAFRQASSEWNGTEKMTGFLNIDQMTLLGLLNRESEIDEDVKMYLLDLRTHPALSFEVVPVGRDNQLQFSFRLLSQLRPES